MRQKLIIAAAAIVILGIGAAVYFLFFTGSATVTTVPGTTSGLPMSGPETSLPGETTSTTTSLVLGSPISVGARLVKIAAGPIVPGEIIVNKEGTASTSPESTVSYIERQSGNVYAYSTLTKAITRISNKTVPGIQSAVWLPDASTAFVRYLSGTDFSTLNTYALPVSGSGGFFLSQNLSDISVSSANILTLASGVNGSSVSLARTDGSHSSSVFTTPLSSLRISFVGKSQYLVFTKPSATLMGNAFLVDGAGRFSRIAGPLTGLVALASPLGKWVLISYTLGNAMQLKLVNVATKESVALPIATIADKCVWAQNDSSVYCGIPMNPSGSNYPDDWYQGAIHFSDRIWKIEVASRYAQLILDFTAETKDALDAEALSIDASLTTLVFVNKNDGSLWSYSL
ncbi:MAG: hypothetical protein NUV60_00240 [Patescibacteria group bacterium]|nr:hypothetical protein [Patescibacteria group bacterium]